MTETNAQAASAERWRALISQGVDPRWLPYLDAAVEAQYGFNGIGKDDGEAQLVAWNIGAILTAIGPSILADHRDELAKAIGNLQQSPHDFGGYFSGQTDAEALVNNWPHPREEITA